MFSKAILNIHIVQINWDKDKNHSFSSCPSMSLHWIHCLYTEKYLYYYEVCSPLEEMFSWTCFGVDHISYVMIVKSHLYSILCMYCLILSKHLFKIFRNFSTAFTKSPWETFFIILAFKYFSSIFFPSNFQNHTAYTLNFQIHENNTYLKEIKK